MFTLSPQVFSPEVQLARTGGWASQTARFSFDDGSSLHWPSDFGRISADLFVRHVHFVRQEDETELGKPIAEAIYKYLKTVYEASQTSSRITVRKITSGPRTALYGQDGVFSTTSLPKHEILIEYGGLVRTQKEHLLHVAQLDLPLADERAMLLNGTQDWTSTEEQRPPLLIDGFFHGNIGGKFNDGRWDPFQRPVSASASASGTESSKVTVPAKQQDKPQFSTSFHDRRRSPVAAEEGKFNCRFVEVILFDWPHVFIMTTEAVAPDTELTVDYGDSFWDTVRLHQGFGLLYDRMSKPKSSNSSAGLDLLSVLAEFVSKL